MGLFVCVYRKDWKVQRSTLLVFILEEDRPRMMVIFLFLIYIERSRVCVCVYGKREMFSFNS